MIDALIKCGADPKIKPCIHQLWSAYLCKLEVAYCDETSPSESENEYPRMEEVDEQPSIIPAWFSQDKDSEFESDEQSLRLKKPKKNTFFAPKKKYVSFLSKFYRNNNHIILFRLKKKASNFRSKIEAKYLLETADGDLSVSERRRKSRKIKVCN
jgi:hypothetical protein